MWTRVSWRSGAAAVILLCFGLASCEDDPSDTGYAGIAQLEVQVMEGHISANLQPIVPPDPIICQLTLRLSNTNSTGPLTGLSIPSAAVFLASTSAELGIFRFETDWDGTIEAGAADTVLVAKIAEDSEIFPPPCGEHVYLRLRVVKTAVQFKQFKTPSYAFGCPVNAPRGGDPAGPEAHRGPSGGRAND